MVFFIVLVFLNDGVLSGRLRTALDAEHQYRIGGIYWGCGVPLVWAFHFIFFKRLLVVYCKSFFFYSVL